MATQIEQPQASLPYNYTKMNWKELNNKLELYLLDLTVINGDTTIGTDIEKFAEQLVKAITKAVQETTPYR